MSTATSLKSYRLLGRSGLRVSPLSLGAMTFGTDWGWGSDEADTRRIFDTYVDRGGCPPSAPMAQILGCKLRRVWASS